MRDDNHEESKEKEDGRVGVQIWIPGAVDSGHSDHVAQNGGLADVIERGVYRAWILSSLFLIADPFEEHPVYHGEK